MEKITRAGALFLAMSHCLLVHFRRTLHAVQSPRPIRLVRALIQHRHRSPNLGPTPSQHAAHTQPTEHARLQTANPHPRHNQPPGRVGAINVSTRFRHGSGRTLGSIDAFDNQFGARARTHFAPRRPACHLCAATPATPGQRPGTAPASARSGPSPARIFVLAARLPMSAPLCPAKTADCLAQTCRCLAGHSLRCILHASSRFWPVAFWSECSCARTLSTHLSPHHPIFPATMARTGPRIPPLAVVALHTSGHRSALVPRPSSLPPRRDSPLSPHKSGRRH